MSIPFLNFFRFFCGVRIDKANSAVEVGGGFGEKNADLQIIGFSIRLLEVGATMPVGSTDSWDIPIIRL